MNLFKIDKAKSQLVHDCIDMHYMEELGLKGFSMKFAYQAPNSQLKGSVPVEHAMFIVSGELVLHTSDGKILTLGPGDAVRFEPGEERNFENRTDKKAGVLIVDVGLKPKVIEPK